MEELLAAHLEEPWEPVPMRAPDRALDLPWLSWSGGCAQGHWPSSTQDRPEGGGSQELGGGQGPEKHLLEWECSPHLRPQVTLPGVADSEERPANKCRTSGKLSAFRFFSPLFLPLEAIRNGSFPEVS